MGLNAETVEKNISVADPAVPGMSGVLGHDGFIIMVNREKHNRKAVGMPESRARGGLRCFASMDSRFRGNDERYLTQNSRSQAPPGNALFGRLACLLILRARGPNEEPSPGRARGRGGWGRARGRGGWGRARGRGKQWQRYHI